MDIYKNIVVMSADRNGSTAFMEEVRKPGSLNGDYEVFLAEAFSQDPDKGQPPLWWNPEEFPPKKVVEAINKGTGKRVVAKIQITWPNFDESFFDIVAERKIFFHRNLIESTLSRCIALKTGLWHSLKKPLPEPTQFDMSVDFFFERLIYRVERYSQYIDRVLDWSNEVYRYEKFDFSPNLSLYPNPSKEKYITNYSEICNLAKDFPGLEEIERKINDKISVQ